MAFSWLRNIFDRKARQEAKRNDYGDPQKAMYIDEQAAKRYLKQEDDSFWYLGRLTSYGAPIPVASWVPQPFFGPALEAWQLNWNQLPACLRALYLIGQCNNNHEMLRVIAEGYQNNTPEFGPKLITSITDGELIWGKHFSVYDGMLWCSLKVGAFDPPPPNGQFLGGENWKFPVCRLMIPDAGYLSIQTSPALQEFNAKRA